MIDTTKEIEIPEGITLSLSVAGYVSRALAFIIDFIIRAVIIFLFSMLFVWLGNMGTGLFYLILFLVEWFYPVLFEMFYFGQTPGKKMLGILVVNDDGTPVNWSSSLVRNLLRFADFLPFFYGFGILSVLFSENFKRLGDFAAGTLVIHKQELKTHTSNFKLKGLAPKVGLNLDEQSAIIAFSERSTSLSEARKNELAGYLAPWLNQDKNSQQLGTPANQLFRIAKWFRGNK